jgi:hypothetical protein
MSQTKVSGTLAYRYHATRVASRPIAAFISLDTGHHAFAFDAIDWNVSRSMPGILAVTVRWLSPRDLASQPSGSMVRLVAQFAMGEAVRGEPVDQAISVAEIVIEAGIEHAGR